MLSLRRILATGVVLAVVLLLPRAEALRSARLEDCERGEPRPPELWVYCQTNLQVDENAQRVAMLLERAGRAGYSRMVLADVKLSRLGTLEEPYFRNAATVKEAAQRAGVELVPAVFPIGYSEGILFHDQDLAEALPVRDAGMIVRDGYARPLEEPRELTEPSWLDELWVREEKGWRCRDPAGANARVVFRETVRPWRQYHLALTIETRDFDGVPEAKVLVGEQGLAFSSLGCKRTQPPTRHHTVFNSLENGEVRIYVGAWGAQGGELAVSDVVLEPAPFLNLVRREGAPLSVRRMNGKTLVEGKDFEPLADPAMGRLPWPGAYDAWHEPPRLRVFAPDDTMLLVSYHHAITVHDGQVTVCPSEKKTLDLLRDEAKRVHGLFGNRTWFMSHDEIRVLNQDESCRRRELDAGELLADHVRDCTRILRALDAKADVWVWSDMFDPAHNARAGYYLVRGDLAGSWEGLEKHVGVAAWHFDERERSLRFFRERGHRLLIAGYYDGPVPRVKEWLEAAAKAGGADAVMYTTWQGRFDDLEAFAEAVRGA